MSLIDQATRDTFKKEGVAILRGVISPDWLARLAQAIEDNMAAPGPSGKDHADAGSAAYFGDYVNWQRFAAFHDVASEGPVGQIAGELMASQGVRLFHEHVLVKEAGNSSATPWHQDMPYYCVSGSQTVSLWVPMEPVTEAVCPRFLAGSHLTQTTYTPRRFKTLAPLAGDMGEYQAFPDVDGDDNAALIRSWALQPGDAVAFDYHTLHNAPPNSSGMRRRVVSLRYVGDDVRLRVRPHEYSPPFTDLGLKLEDGAALPDDWFPKVWSNPLSSR